MAGGDAVKIRIETDADIEEEIVIKCRQLTPEIIGLQRALSEAVSCSRQLALFRGDTEYYIETKDILFFETEGTAVMAHTAADIYETRLRLYELEELLPASFMRISKSSIVNTDRIYSINRNLTASSAVEFQGTHKQVYVSRGYYKALKEKLEEKR